jgi:hypothetical protein
MTSSACVLTANFHLVSFMNSATFLLDYSKKYLHIFFSSSFNYSNLPFFQQCDMSFLRQCIKSNVYESFYIFTLTKISPRHYSFFHYALNIILSFIAQHEKPYIALRHNIGIIITVRFSCFTISSWFTWWHLE